MQDVVYSHQCKGIYLGVSKQILCKKRFRNAVFTILKINELQK